MDMRADPSAVEYIGGIGMIDANAGTTSAPTIGGEDDPYGNYPLLMGYVEEFADAVQDGLDEVVANLGSETFPINGLSRKKLREIKISLDEYRNKRRARTIIRNLEQRMHAEFVSSQNPEFTRLYPNQVRAAVLVCFAILLNGDRAGLLRSVTQSGKSGTQVAIALLLPMFAKLLFNRDVVVVNVLTPHISFEKQTNAEYTSHRNLYGEVVAACGRKEESIHSLTSLHWSNIRMTDTRDQVVIRRTSGKISILEEAFERANDKGYSVVLLIDEMHWGSGSTGNTTRVLGLLDTYRTPTNQHNAVFVSATVYQLDGMAKRGELWDVRQSLKSDLPYQGFNWSCGEILDTETANIIPLPYSDYSEYAAEHGMWDAQVLHSYSAYENAKSFGLARRMGELRGVTANMKHARYRHRVECGLGELMNHMLFDENPLDAFGVMIRFCKKNVSAGRLFRTINENSPFSGQVIPVVYNCGAGTKGNAKFVYNQDGYYEASTSYTLKSCLVEIAASLGLGNPFNGDMTPEEFGARFCIWVTGSGRMGTQVPKEIGYFIDGTKAHSSNSSLLQNLLGRAMGFGKNSWVFLSPQGYKCTKLMDKTKGRDGVRRPDQRAYLNSTTTGEKINRQGKLDLIIYRGTDVPGLENAFDAAEHYMNAKLRKAGKIANSLTGKSAGRNSPFYKWFDESVMAAIEKHASKEFVNPCILRRGEMTTDGKYHFRSYDDASRSDVGFRNIKTGRVRSQNSNQHRQEVAQQRASDDASVLKPQFVAEYKGGRWHISRLEIRMRNRAYNIGAIFNGKKDTTSFEPTIDCTYFATLGKVFEENL